MFWWILVRMFEYEALVLGFCALLILLGLGSALNGCNSNQLCFLCIFSDFALEGDGTETGFLMINLFFLLITVLANKNVHLFFQLETVNRLFLSFL